MAKMNYVRILLSLAANKNQTLHQFNVKNIFLHGDLEEKVYMNIPPNFDGSKLARKSVQTREIIVWPKTISTSMVQEIHPFDA